MKCASIPGAQETASFQGDIPNSAQRWRRMQVQGAEKSFQPGGAEGRKELQTSCVIQTTFFDGEESGTQCVNDKAYQWPDTVPKLTFNFFFTKMIRSWVLVAHVCNPSYSGGRDQEDCGLKPAQENSSRDPILKIPNTKKGWWSGSRCSHWVETPVLQNNNNNNAYRKIIIKIKK
jgi:hypothetical protein